MKHFHGQSSPEDLDLSDRVARSREPEALVVRHKAQETSIEPAEAEGSDFSLGDRLVDRGESPFDNFRSRRGANGGGKGAA
jgi:hypothetical protein